MRSLVVMALFASTSVLAAEPYCALPAPAAMRVADDRPAIPIPPPTTPSAPLASVSAVPSVQALPDTLAALPFVRHVQASGSIIIDLGSLHGVRSIAAKSGDQLMIFQVAADGRSAVSGAITEITPAQLSMLAGDNVTELGTEHGFRGLHVRSGPQFQVFYVTPDQQRVIPGVLYDADGKDLTRQQVANIPGAIPTVVVGTAEPGQPPSPAAPVLPLVMQASAGTIGPASAPHLWMLIDPQCIYSVRAYQALQPHVAAGRLQLSLIPVSILDHEDQGQSTRSALGLLSKPAAQMAAAWQSGNLSGPPAPEAAERLRANMAISQAIKLTGTPLLIWRKTDGSEGRIDGMPSNIEALLASIGG